MAQKSSKDKKVTGAPELPEEQKKHDDPVVDAKADAEPKKHEPAAPDSEDEKPQAQEPIEDKQTDEAIDDIIRTESDELLDAQDAKTEKVQPTGKKHWWQRVWVRWALAVLLLAIIGLMVFPTTRYWILNTAGVRVSASVTVVDTTTGQPLKNVKVTIGSSETSTDAEGTAKVDKIKLGPGTLKLERIAFASLEKQVVLGWGSNPLGKFELQAVGAQYTMIVRDYLSNQPVVGAEAASGQAAARSDDSGNIVLTLEKSDGSDVTATVSAPGYRTDEFTLKADVTVPNDVVLVPSTKEVFVSKETGKYDVYSMDIDGKNRKVLLAGTGLESGNIGLAASPDGERVALVSTRDNVRTADGRLLNTLTLINVANGDSVVLDRGEQIQLMDWVGNRIIYHMVANVATDATDRHRINSYDFKADSRAQLAKAVQIRSAASALGVVYYTDGTGYFRINPDGSAKQTVLDKEVWASYRTAYEELSLQTASGWYKLNLNSGTPSQVAEPSSYASRIFVTNQAGSQSLWIDKSALQLYDIAAAKNTPLHTQDGLVYPVRWLNNTNAIFRVAAGQDIADYVQSSQGGAARKLGPVTNSYGINPAF